MAQLRVPTRGATAFLVLFYSITQTGCLSGSRPYAVQGADGGMGGYGAGALMTAGANNAMPNGMSQAGLMQAGMNSPTVMPNGAMAGMMQPGAMNSGCTTCGHRTYVGGPVNAAPAGGPMGDCPRELDMISLPPYKVAPPDILFIDLVRMVPRPPYQVEPLETIVVNVGNTLPGEPISGPFVISPEGTINLGFRYGTVRVGGMTIDQIQNAIRAHLTPRILANAQVTVALGQFRGFQNIRGEHLVRPDGTISLGVYGSVYVAGMSLGQAKCVIEKHLSEYFLNPQISIDVFAYNSRVIYVIVDGGGLGQQVFRLPSTGNETVLDAISQVQGLAPVSSKKRIWVARPSPVQLGCNQVLPVDWRAITEGGSTATNYQLFPGDRVYVAANPLIAFDNYLSIVLAPIERLLGVTFLGAETVSAVRGAGSSSGGTTAIVP